jgi:hypothetical protein
MKKIVAFICVFLMLLSSITGCSLFTKEGAQYAAGVVNIKAESVLIKSQYSRVYALVLDNKAKFGDDEWKQLMDVHFAFSESAARIEKLMESPKNVITPSELKQMYELAYIGYADAREILNNHKDGFTKFQWEQLINFDKQAVIYDKQVRSILDNPNTDDINITLGIIITLGSVAYKYLLPLLISAI